MLVGTLSASTSWITSLGSLLHCFIVIGPTLSHWSRKLVWWWRSFSSGVPWVGNVERSPSISRWNFIHTLLKFGSPVGRGCIIHRLHLYREVRPNLNECPGYVTKLFDGRASVLEFSGMGCTNSLPLLPDPLWPRLVVPVWVRSLS